MPDVIALMVVAHRYTFSVNALRPAFSGFDRLLFCLGRNFLALGVLAENCAAKKSGALATPGGFNETLVMIHTKKFLGAATGATGQLFLWIYSLFNCPP